jgi:hypothetical protein
MLLDTINQLDDHDDGSSQDLPISPDGRFLLLGGATEAETPQPIPKVPSVRDVPMAGQGDSADPDSESEA